MRCCYTKWGGRSHRAGTMLWLGADEHGHWLGEPSGTRWSGGPSDFTSVTDNVLLVPPGQGFTAMFYRPHPGQLYGLYCDITTAAQWVAEPVPTVTAVDLDLDVVREWSGRVFVDDEDEFVEHRVALGYPAEVVTAAREACTRVLADVLDGAPWSVDSAADPWRATLRDLLRR